MYPNFACIKDYVYPEYSFVIMLLGLIGLLKTIIVITWSGTKENTRWQLS